MSNQVILWAIFILPWFTLFFMKREDAKRFMPVGLFAVFTSAIILETGVTLKWWAFNETAFPLRNISYLYGLLPVATIWIFKFTYGRFWLYVVADALLNLFFAYVFEYYFLGRRGIEEFLIVSPFVSFLITWALGLVLYAFQMWQEGIFAHKSR